MKVLKGFKFRLYPTAKQIAELVQCGGNARFIYNYAIVENRKHYNNTGKFLFYNDLANRLPELKRQYEFLKISFAQSLQQVLRNFERTLKTAYKKDGGFPKYKKKNEMCDSFAYPQNWKIKSDCVYIPKIGDIKWVKHRTLQGKPKSVTISQDGDKWYCSVLCECIIKDKKMKTDRIVGCDVGLKKFITLSDGTVVNKHNFTKDYEKKLATAQRRLSRKVKDSNNKNKQRLKVRKIQNKIRDSRNDFLHKLSNSIAKNYDGIVVENLIINKMLKDKRMAKAISDASWSEFIRQVEYKCKWNFKYFIKIDTYYPSSKTCSACGFVQPMPLYKRKFKCPVCKLNMDRDLNASKNILNKGLFTVGLTGINACGDDSLESSMKQERLV